MADGDRNRAVLQQHCQALEAGDLDAEHAIYADDVVVEYPQTGERVRGLDNVRAIRGHHPAQRQHEVHRLVGDGNVWVTVRTSGSGTDVVHTVSVLEFEDGKVRRETRYVAEPFDAPQWRAPWVETEEYRDQTDRADGSDRSRG